MRSALAPLTRLGLNLRATRGLATTAVRALPDDPSTRKPTPAERAAADAIETELHAEGAPSADPPKLSAKQVKEEIQNATTRAAEKAASAAAAIKDSLNAVNGGSDKK